MAMSSERPVNLDLTTFHFPVTAIASTLHRVCGVILFFGSFVLMALLGLSLENEAGFADVLALLELQAEVDDGLEDAPRVGHVQVDERRFPRRGSVRWTRQSRGHGASKEQEHRARGSSRVRAAARGYRTRRACTRRCRAARASR